MPSLSRRLLLSSAPAAALAPLPAPAATSSREMVDRLWTTLLRIEAESLDLWRRHAEAEAAMPWWARPGRRYLVAKGEPERPETSHAPAIVELERPSSPGSFRIHRIDMGDIEREHRRASFWSADKADEARDRRLEAYEARRRAQQAEQRRVGLPDLEDQQEAKGNELDAVLTELEAIRGSLEAAAAVTLYWAITSGSPESTFNFGDEIAAAMALERLLPMIAGPVAATVADHLEHRDRPHHRSPLWGCIFAPEASET